jgi:hypothetical protein
MLLLCLVFTTTKLLELQRRCCKVELETHHFGWTRVFFSECAGASVTVTTWKNYDSLVPELDFAADGAQDDRPLPPILELPQFDFSQIFGR